MVNDKQNTPDKIKYVAKLQMQKYIESFFTGKNKHYMSIASPSFVNYDISKSSVESNSIKEKKLQIARYFNELKNYLPAILIIDGGIRNVPQSFNNITNSFGKLSEPEYEISPTRDIDIGILIGSNDVQTTDDLVTAVSMMFNDFRSVSGGNLISGDINKDENWSIMLPISGINFGPIQENAINGDAVDKIYFCEANISIFYEDKIRFKYSSNNLSAMAVNHKLKPELDIPNEISANSQLQIKVKNYNPELRVMLDNYKVATLNNRGLLTPRSFGDVIVKILDKRNNVLDEKLLKIV